MKKSTGSEGGGGLILFALGAVFGVAAALLLAPDSGDGSRKRLGHWLHEHRDLGHDFFAKFRHILSIRHNGAQAVNGHAGGARRHKRGA